MVMTQWLPKRWQWFDAYEAGRRAPHRCCPLKANKIWKDESGTWHVETRDFHFRGNIWKFEPAEEPEK